LSEISDSSFLDNCLTYFLPLLFGFRRRRLILSTHMLFNVAILYPKQKRDKVIFNVERRYR